MEEEKEIEEEGIGEHQVLTETEQEGEVFHQTVLHPHTILDVGTILLPDHPLVEKGTRTTMKRRRKRIEKKCHRDKKKVNWMNMLPWPK